MSGNDHKACECPYCWCVVYSEGALTRHINAEHWREVEKEKRIALPPIEKITADDFKAKNTIIVYTEVDDESA